MRRDQQFKDNASLPPAFNIKAGDLIYSRLVSGFEGQEFDAPPACDAASSFTSVTNQPTSRPET